VCEFLLWDLGALWSLDRQASVLRCVEVWHKESVKVPQFEAVRCEITFMPGIGLPGRVWSRHEPAYISDVVHDTNFPHASIAAREGLHAAFAFPILLGGDVLGVMEFFSREIRQPEQELLNMMATLGSQIGQFIERKRAEDVNARLAAIVESSDDAIISKDLQGTIMSWNNGAARMFGYTAAEAVGQSIAMLIPTRFVDEEPRILERIRRGETLEHYETVRRHKDGREINISLTVSPLRDDAGNVVGASKIARDITERKRVEQRLLTQHTVTRILAEAASLQEAAPRILRAICASLIWNVAALWTVDKEAGVLRCVEVWHDESVEVPQFEAICRQHTFMPGVGLPGRVWSSHEPAYIPDVVHDTNFPRASIAAREGLHAAFGFPILLGGDVLGVIEFFSKEIRQPGQDLLNMMTAIGSQIGQFIERKRAEEAFRTAQMELAHVTRVATLGEMTASIAHEINQPLGALVNNAGACLGWLDAGNLEESRNSVTLMMDDAQRASEIITRIRALVKKAPPQKDWLDINQIIREVIALAQSELQRNRITLETQLSDNVPPILADRIQLQQVMLNLMMNAIEAMTQVTTPRELLISSEADDSKGVVVVVRDSGAGLDSKSLERLFEPFYTTKPQGMGMGLAICRSIIQAHGGRLWATANEGPGAAFQFTLQACSKRE
jgi:PAS domain S-box-containing protein